MPLFTEKVQIERGHRISDSLDSPLRRRQSRAGADDHFASQRESANDVVLWSHHFNARWHSHWTLDDEVRSEQGLISALRAMVVSILTGSVLAFWFFAVGKVEPDNPGFGYALDGHENVTCCYYGEVVNSDLQGAISISTDASNISESSMFIMRRSGAMNCASAVAGNDGTGWSIGLQMSILSFLMGGFYASTSAFMKSVLCMMAPPCMQAELFSISEICESICCLCTNSLFIFNSVAHSNSCVVEDQYAALGVFSILGRAFWASLLFCVDLERARKKALAVNGAIRGKWLLMLAKMPLR